ncbi:MAG TPA: YHYH protein [Flavobacteriales bacterium]|nr:YHYH protein [Flavobacteriales bacterium]
MKYILLSSLLSISLIAQSQPEIDSWMLNTTGTLGSYDDGSGTTTMTDSADVLQVCYSSSTVYIRAEGLPAYQAGPWAGNPNVPSAQGYTFMFPRTPQQESGTKTGTPIVGPEAVAVNGVVMYGYGDGKSYNPMNSMNEPMGAGVWNSDAWLSEGSSMDATGAGHPDMNGNYHYHATPIQLYSDAGTAHSPIVGFAFDGFPIYGPFGYTSPMDNSSAIKRMVSGYELRSITTRTTLPDGSTASSAGPTVGGGFPLGTYIEDYKHLLNGDLDAYNGRSCVTPEYPTGTYAYFITTDVSGNPAFPYILAGEYYGEVAASDVGPPAGNQTIPGGVTCATSSVQGVSIDYLLAVFPNPATDRLRVVRLNSAAIDFKMTDLAGKVVKAGALLSNETDIPLDELTTGFYFLNVRDGDRLVATTKIIVQ